MALASLFEGTMLFCFSIGWYWSIAAMIRTRTAQGKSIWFVCLITAGYLLGATSKVLAWGEGGALSWLFWLYLWNMLVCAVDLLLVLHFARRDRTGPEVLARAAA